MAHGVELLEGSGPVRARRMVGGFGLHVDGLFVALIAFERLYLKAGEAGEPLFRQAGGQRFGYAAEGRTVALRDGTPPAEALAAPALMQPWARRAMQAALSAGARPAARPAQPSAAAPGARKPPQA